MGDNMFKRKLDNYKRDKEIGVATVIAERLIWKINANMDLLDLMVSFYVWK